ncbi:MAG TPA: phosphopyruvate hydratase [Thermoplasmata archaeon]|nr:phosphopyruvate hydratase [Thermoplasmata archaeon]
MPSIEAAEIRKILDSRGDPTVEVDILAEGARGRAAAPSGASTGTHEVRAFPEGGVDAAIPRFREEIEPRLIGLEVTAQKDIDGLLQQIDGTPDFSRIGGNVAVATSLAVAKAAANSFALPLFRYLGGAFAHRLPHPMGNVIGGGRHAIGGTTIQEFLAVAQGPTVAASVFANARVHRVVRDILREKHPSGPLGRGDEGAWVAAIEDEEALIILSEACRTISHEVAFDVAPALDLAASEFYRDGKYRYRDRALSPQEQVDFVAGLVERYGLFSVEDPLQEEDFAGYARLTALVGGKCHVIGDDLFATNVERLQKGIRIRAANAILIKPNQIGTLSGAKAAVDLAHRHGYATVMSHRSGETTDETIAHLAVAFGCLGIKTGAVGGERIAKLNELIRIEEGLVEG